MRTRLELGARERNALHQVRGDGPETGRLRRPARGEDPQDGEDVLPDLRQLPAEVRCDVRRPRVREGRIPARGIGRCARTRQDQPAARNAPGASAGGYPGREAAPESLTGTGTQAATGCGTGSARRPASTKPKAEDNGPEEGSDPGKGDGFPEEAAIRDAESRADGPEEAETRKGRPLSGRRQRSGMLKAEATEPEEKKSMKGRRFPKGSPGHGC